MSAGRKAAAADRRLPGAGVLLGFQDEDGSAFAEAESGAPGVEGSATVAGDQQERAETVQGQGGQGVNPAGQHEVDFAGGDEVAGGGQGGGPGGAGVGDGHAESPQAELGGERFCGGGATVMAEAVLVGGGAGEEVAEKALALEHAAGAGAENDGGRGPPRAIETGVAAGVLRRLAGKSHAAGTATVRNVGRDLADGARVRSVRPGGRRWCHQASCRGRRQCPPR